MTEEEYILISSTTAVRCAKGAMNQAIPPEDLASDWEAAVKALYRLDALLTTRTQTP